MQMIAQNTNSVIPGQSMRIAANQDFGSLLSTAYAPLPYTSFDEHYTVDEYAQLKILIHIWNAKNLPPLAVPESRRTISLYNQLFGQFWTTFKESLDLWHAFCQRMANTPLLNGSHALGWQPDAAWCLSHAQTITDGNYGICRPQRPYRTNYEESVDVMEYASLKSHQYKVLQILASEPDLRLKKLKVKLIQLVGIYIYQDYFADLSQLTLMNHELILTVSSPVLRDHCQHYYADMILAAAQEFNTQITFIQINYEHEILKDIDALKLKVKQFQSHQLPLTKTDKNSIPEIPNYKEPIK